MRGYRIYLHDIIDAMEKIETFTGSISFEDFCADEKTISAVRDKLIIIGEASKHVPEKVRRRSSGDRLAGYGRDAGHPYPRIFQNRSRYALQYECDEDSPAETAGEKIVFCGLCV